jgi:predicted glycoside hydrolase/deacetylase ChbG (UPF0249 family)
MKNLSADAANSRSAVPPPANLIVNADDFGYFDHVSDGILDCVDAGAVTATGVMTNSPAFAMHAERLQERPGVDIGVHLTLTSGEPLTREMRHATTRWAGRFPSKWSIVKAVMSRQITGVMVQAEWRHQIERCLSSGLRPVFLNSHEHLHMLPPLFEQVMGLASEFGIRHVRRSLPEKPSTASPGALVRDAALWALGSATGNRQAASEPRLVGMGISGRIDLAYLRTMLPRLEPACTYELMCHPGRPPLSASIPPELLAYHGWEQERSTFTSQAFRELLHTANVRLLRFRDLAT